MSVHLPCPGIPHLPAMRRLPVSVTPPSTRLFLTTIRKPTLTNRKMLQSRPYPSVPISPGHGGPRSDRDHWTQTTPALSPRRPTRIRRRQHVAGIGGHGTGQTGPTGAFRRWITGNCPACAESGFARPCAQPAIRHRSRHWRISRFEPAKCHRAVIRRRDSSRRLRAWLNRRKQSEWDLTSMNKICLVASGSHSAAKITIRREEDRT